MAITQPIRSPEELKRLADYFLERKQLRNYVLVVLGVCTGLRVSDLLRLRWEDVYDFRSQTFRSHLELLEQKTGKRKIVALNAQAIKALSLYFPERNGDYIFASDRVPNSPMSRQTAWRTITLAAKSVNIEGTIGCHGLRKTFGYRCWRDQQLSPAILMELFNHSSYAVTRRYLGIAQDELDSAYLNMNLF